MFLSNFFAPMTEAAQTSVIQKNLSEVLLLGVIYQYMSDNIDWSLKGC